MDPAEDIADALVDYVNALRSQDPNPLSLTCQASNPDDPKKELEFEHQTIQVFFVPFGEEEEKIGRGSTATERQPVLDTQVVDMLVVRKMTPEFTRRRLGGFVREIKDQIRGVRMAGYVYSTAETVLKFDLERLNVGQFCSVVRINYKRCR